MLIYVLQTWGLFSIWPRTGRQLSQRLDFLNKINLLQRVKKEIAYHLKNFYDHK